MSSARIIGLAGAGLFVLCAACSDDPAVDDGGLQPVDSGLPDSAASDSGTSSDGAPADTGSNDSGQDASALDSDVQNDGGVSDAGVDGGADGGPDGGGGGDAASGMDVTSYVYVGSSDDNIYRYRLNPQNGTLSPLGMTPAGVNPSFLAVDPSHHHLYAVNENGSNGRVAAFAIDPSDGDLSFLNRVSAMGNGPTHLSVDASGGWVLVANYNGGTVSVLPIMGNGSLGAVSETEAPGANAHLIITDPANHFAFVPCLGSNYVAQFAFDATLGTLTPNAVPTVASVGGAGPRHMAFHPSGQWAYVINELGSSMTSYDYDSNTGQLSATQTLSTLPAGFTGNNSCAEVVVHPNGQFVFGSNRGHDSIVVFAVNGTNGQLSLVDHTGTGGDTPRNFGISPDGEYLLVANQDSANIQAFRVNGVSGALTDLGSVAKVAGPAFVGVVTVP